MGFQRKFIQVLRSSKQSGKESCLYISNGNQYKVKIMLFYMLSKDAKLLHCFTTYLILVRIKSIDETREFEGKRKDSIEVVLRP